MKNEKLGALWLKKSKNGEGFLTGEVSGVKVVVFKNKYKETEAHPDYIVYKSIPKAPETNDDDMPFC